MKIYTRTGDHGETGLFGGLRVRKNDPRVTAYGTIDELNACLGLAQAHGVPTELKDELAALQEQLFVVGAELASEPGKAERLKMRLIDEAHVQHMEGLIDAHEAELAPLTHFILPGGGPCGAALHLARTIARRAERLCLELPELRPELVIYLNRVSDYLFVFARRANQLQNRPETPWRGREG